MRREAINAAPLGGKHTDIIDKVLRNRGIQSQSELSVQGKHLLHYNKLKDIEKAANLLADAVVNHQQVFIVGDFDADGATSTALCILAFRKMGLLNVQYIVPNRFDYGYGLSPPVVDLAYQAGAKVLVTVDNGISSIEGVKHAKSLGMTVVVTDHHLPSDVLPIADAIVNPNQTLCEFESKNLAGVGVAFYVMSATKNVLVERGYFTQQQIPVPNMANFLDIVAVGTVADVVVLDKNNRILVHQGIQRIRSGKTRPGILALLNISGRDYSKCCTTDIGFVIGPRLNAAGRLEDMSHGIECLLCECINEAATLALALDALNQSRREIEQSMKDKAELALATLSLDAKNMPAALVLYNEDYHQGVVGIVAGRMKERYYRPTIVFANDNEHTLKGSARSIQGVHIRDVLARVDSLQPALIHKFGGHAMAAGLSIAKVDLPLFQTVLIQVVSNLTQNLPKEAIIYSDGELSEQQLTLENAHELKYSMPWGQGFEEPQFDGVFTLVNQRIVGKNHLKMTLAQNQVYIDAIAFNVDIQAWPNHKVNEVKMAYKLDINEFRGQTTLQLMVSDLVAVE
ncbi:single-stranded-DNA-specific exonuclease RecJ [Glaciecola punicea]|uniref:single-stranded-DNA-specific exonuclease RecJ n=1 Tax=Glaciecola punicea TaxID=56804 RepID=UPI0008721725|nr:single-stranded-DNA-specific exonuclease RecJ [Glaciecola punicea]OFA30177.1 single-stranded-DNA-specific exonuclease RecJ [Glaciecola punicea]